MIDRWDFYQARVDDAPASITLDFGWEETPRPAGCDWLYWCSLTMADPDDHGMGSAVENARLGRVEDVLQDRLDARGLVHVGRLRNRGEWQLSYYGPAGLEDVVRQAAAHVLAAAGVDLPLEVGSKHDPGWSYYDDFLLPDAERRRWIEDRRVVDVLMDEGDPLTRDRRIDHWAYFPDASARDRFVEEARQAGFERALTPAQNDGARPHGAQVHRVDSARVNDVHAVVMQLTRLAEAHGGEYDGWETSVETD